MLAWVGRPGTGDQIFYAIGLLDSSPDPARKSFRAGGEEHELLAGLGSDVGRGEWVGTPRPTPFRGTTSLEFALSRRAAVRLTVYDVAGRAVRTLLNETRPAGRHEASWNGRSDCGVAVLPGVYFLRLDAGELHANRKIVLQR